MTPTLSHSSLYEMVRLPQSSEGSAAKDDAAHGAGQDHDVQPDRPIAHVVSIQRYSLFVSGIAASAHLPKPGDTRCHPLVQFGHFTVFGNFLIYDGPRSD